ncbi:MAG: class B sortase [Eubacteriales bacterium]|nr:class B sortase [Eubacteriales bacterium]
MNTHGQRKLSRRAGRGRRRAPVLLYCLMGFLLGVVLISGTFVALDLWEYRKAIDEYASLEQYMGEADRQEESGGQIQGTDEMREDYPPLDIDYETLAKINPDFAGVLYIPALSLRYPVAASRDNAEYLTRTFEGQENSSGCIFMDTYTNTDMSSVNSFIFGHNMKNGTMFGSLKRFYQEEGLCASDPYVYLYTPDAVYQYEIFSYYLADMYSDAYQDFAGAGGYDDYVRRAISRSAYQPERAMDYSLRPRLLTLSTCAGASGSAERFLVHGVLTGVYEGKGDL